jgi:hypothetical protein
MAPVNRATRRMCWSQRLFSSRYLQRRANYRPAVRRGPVPHGMETREEQKEKSERKQPQSLHLETVLPYSKEPVKASKLGTERQSIPFTLDRTLRQRTSCMVRLTRRIRSTASQLFLLQRRQVVAEILDPLSRCYFIIVVYGTENRSPDWHVGRAMRPDTSAKTQHIGNVVVREFPAVAFGERG